MEKKYKCGMCGSEAIDTPGTCCGGERKAVESKMKNMEHNHKEGETCKVCSC